MAVRNGIRELPSVERFAVEKLIRTKRTRRVNALQDFIALPAFSDVRKPEYLFSKLVQIQDFIRGDIAYINDFIHFLHNNLQQALRAVFVLTGNILCFGKRCCHNANPFTFWMTTIFKIAQPRTS